MIINFKVFSPNSFSNFSNKTISSVKKKSLSILPIRNLINQKKAKERQIRNKNKNKIENIGIKLKKGPGKSYTIHVTNY